MTTFVSKDLRICECVKDMGYAEFHDDSHRAVGVTASSPYPKVVARKNCPRCAGTGLSHPNYQATTFLIRESMKS
jgi:hypothetical protein